MEVRKKKDMEAGVGGKAEGGGSCYEMNSDVD